MILRRSELILPAAHTRRSSLFRLGFFLVASTSVWAQPNHKPDGPLDGLFQLKDSKTSRISSADPSGGNMDWIVIAPGETKTLAEISGTGVIRRFYFGTGPADRLRFRKLILRMYWDGEKDPCVEVPFGDFFGSGLGTLRYIHSAVVDVNPGFQDRDFDAMVSYFPMPFEKGARITLENDGKVPGFRLWYHFDIEHYPDGVLPPNSGRLHAQWRRAPRPAVAAGSIKNTTLGNNGAKNTTGKDNYLVLDAAGQGTYAGLFLIVDNLMGKWYGEGDDMIYVDGATTPAYAGTLIENRDKNFSGKNQMYRFYVNDPVRFAKSIRVTIEHGHANNLENDYTSTAFWYQKDPHKAFPAIPTAADRAPAWPEDVRAALATELKFPEMLAKARKEGKAPMSAADQKRMQALTATCNRAFRELRFKDYVGAVAAMETLLANQTGARGGGER